MFMLHTFFLFTCAHIKWPETVMLTNFLYPNWRAEKLFQFQTLEPFLNHSRWAIDHFELHLAWFKANGSTNPAGSIATTGDERTTLSAGIVPPSRYQSNYAFASSGLWIFHTLNQLAGQVRNVPLQYLQVHNYLHCLTEFKRNYAAKRWAVPFRVGCGGLLRK